MQECEHLDGDKNSGWIPGSDWPLLAHNPGFWLVFRRFWPWLVLQLILFISSKAPQKLDKTNHESYPKSESYSKIISRTDTFLNRLQSGHSARELWLHITALTSGVCQTCDASDWPTPDPCWPCVCYTDTMSHEPGSDLSCICVFPRTWQQFRNDSLYSLFTINLVYQCLITLESWMVTLPPNVVTTQLYEVSSDPHSVGSPWDRGLDKFFKLKIFFSSWRTWHSNSQLCKSYHECVWP